MGTWGSGNLDNDYARDVLDDRARRLVDALLARARSAESRELDDVEYTTLFVDFEMLFALDDRGLVPDSALPEAAEVEALAASYLADWDTQIDEMEPTPEHKRTRRAIIAHSFERLRQMGIVHRQAELGGLGRRLVFVSGPPGVGKSTVLAAVAEGLPDAAWLDGDSVWQIRPFRVDERTKNQVEGNIAAVLRGHLTAGFDTVLLGWVLHDADLITRLGVRIGRQPDQVIGLVCRPDVLVARRTGRGETNHEHALVRLAQVQQTCPDAIDTSDLSPEAVVQALLERLQASR